MSLRRFLAIASLLALAVPAHAQPAGLTLEDRQAIARRLYALVQQYFAHWDGAPRTRVEAAYHRYVDEAGRAADRHAFDLASLRFVAALRNGHSQFVDEAADARPLKFRLLDVEGEWAVVFSQDARLPRGAVVRTINGTPVAAAVEGLSEYVAASNARLARTHVFSYPVLFPTRVSLGLKSGETIVIDRSVPVDGASAPPLAQSGGRWVQQDRVAYIKIPSFGDPAYESSALELVGRYSSAAALIIDVRGNGGGATPGRLIASIMSRGYRTWQQLAPARIPSRSENPSADAFTGRVFILIDRFCGSACEDFVMPFKDNHRAVLIGEVTQGSSGNPYRTDLGLGIRVAIGAVRYAFPDGRPFESIGIAPDVVVLRRLADLASGRDAVLERAEALAGIR